MCGTPADGAAHPTMEPLGVAHAGSMREMAGVIARAAGDGTIIMTTDMATDTPTDITNRHAVSR